MSSFLGNMKIDSWWKALILLGIGLMGVSVIYKVDFIEQKHSFGCGIGMVLIGFSIWMAQKNNTAFGLGGMFQWKSTNHNILTGLLLLVGIGLTGLFGFLIVKGLI